MGIVGNVIYTTDINKPLKTYQLGSLMTGDKYEYRYTVHLTAGKEIVDCTAVTFNAYLIRADGKTVVWLGEGTTEGVVVDVPESAHAVPGRFALAVQATLANVTHTVFAAEGTVIRSSTDTIVDPGHVVPNVQELLALIGRMEAALVPVEQFETVLNAHWTQIDALTTATEQLSESVEGISGAVDGLSNDVDAIHAVDARQDAEFADFSGLPFEWVDGYYVNANGNLNTDAAQSATDFVDVGNYKKVKFPMLEAYESRKYVLYDKDKKALSSGSAVNSTVTVDVSAAKYLRVSCISARKGDFFLRGTALWETLGEKQDKLIAGTGIIIAEDGKTISATGGGGGGVDLDRTLTRADAAAPADLVGEIKDDLGAITDDSENLFYMTNSVESDNGVTLVMTDGGSCIEITGDSTKNTYFPVLGETDRATPNLLPGVYTLTYEYEGIGDEEPIGGNKIAIYADGYAWSNGATKDFVSTANLNIRVATGTKFSQKVKIMLVRGDTGKSYEPHDALTAHDNVARNKSNEALTAISQLKDDIAALQREITGVEATANALSEVIG